MNRRDFLHTAAAGMLAAGAQAMATAQEPSPAKAVTKQPKAKNPDLKKANLKLGTQHGDSDDILKAMAAFGVNHICAEPPSPPAGQQQKSDDWSVDGLARKREHIESFGLQVEALRLLHPTY